MSQWLDFIDIIVPEINNDRTLNNQTVTHKYGRPSSPRFLSGQGQLHITFFLTDVYVLISEVSNTEIPASQ